MALAESREAWILYACSPPTSVPKATGHNPDETIAPGPADEPPAYRCRSWGFLAVLFHPIPKDLHIGEEIGHNFKITNALCINSK